MHRSISAQLQGTISSGSSLDELVRLVGDYIGDSRKLAPSPQMRIASVQTAARKI